MSYPSRSGHGYGNQPRRSSHTSSSKRRNSQSSLQQWQFEKPKSKSHTAADNLEISTSSIKSAISKAETENPSFWQAEMIEIAMIPSVKKAIEEMNNGRKLNIERVKTKFGNGYILEGWNSIRDDYYSTNPSKVWDGLRREFIGAQDLEFLRMIAYGEDYAKTQLRHFKIKDEPIASGRVTDFATTEDALPQFSPQRSDDEIARWQKIRDDYVAKGYPLYERDPKMPWREPFYRRLSGYKASLSLSRGFGETSEAFDQRSGLKKFFEWKP